MTHDPHDIILLIRDQLAAHDKPVAFFFGAGTSCAVNVAPEPEAGEKRSWQPLIPAIEQLTKTCAKAVAKLGDNFETAWIDVSGECEHLDGSSNIENILSRVRLKLSAMGNAETPLGLSRGSLEKFEAEICTTIARVAAPDEQSIPEQLPHDQFADWVKLIRRHQPIEIFTANYDVLIERSLERAAVPVFDGFVGVHEPFFFAPCVDDEQMLPGPPWVRLWKVHGSINWYDAPDGSNRILRGPPPAAGATIIHPSYRKYDDSRKQPYQALLDRLDMLLRKRSAVLFTAGYSFSDQHINALLYQALDSNPHTHVIALMYTDLEEGSALVRAASNRQNMILVGSRHGVVGGQFAEWRLRTPIDGSNHHYMDIPFDSDAVLDNAPALAGTMRLGDFNFFCRFLTSLRESHA